MWCPNCKSKSPTVAVGNDELICAHCKTEVVASVPAPKSRSKSKVKSQTASSTSFETSDSSVEKPPRATKPEVTFVEPTSEQTVASAQAVVKAWTDSHRKWRADNAHLVGNFESKNESESKTIHDSQTKVAKKLESVNEPESFAAPAAPHYHLILFGLFVYLVGHALTIWSFLAGHFGAWTIGNFCSVGGVAIAIVSIVQALRNLESKPTRRTKRRSKGERKRSHAASTTRKRKSNSTSSRN